MSNLINHSSDLESQVKQLSKEVNVLKDEINKIKKQKDISKSENYREYYFAQKTRDPILRRLAETIDQEGTILEFKALNNFVKFGYTANGFFYLDSNTKKSRQIDILAKKNKFFQIPATNTHINLNAYIVADCKYKSQIDLLCFDTKCRLDQFINLPIFVSPVFGFEIHNDLDPALLVTNKITQLEMGAYSMSKDHLRDELIYSWCMQVYDCVNHVYRERLNAIANEVNRQLNKRIKLQESVHIFSDQSFENNPDYFRQKLALSSIYELFEGIDVIYFEMIIPALILDENRGILKAIIDTNYQLTELQDIEAVLYQFSSVYQFHDLNPLKDYIFISNRNGLPKVLSYIDRYMDNFEQRFRKTFERNPSALFKLFNLIG